MIECCGQLFFGTLLRLSVQTTISCDQKQREKNAPMDFTFFVSFQYRPITCEQLLHDRQRRTVWRGTDLCQSKFEKYFYSSSGHETLMIPSAHHQPLLELKAASTRKQYYKLNKRNTFNMCRHIVI